MDTITGEWIKERLGNKHGDKAKLAAAMGISRDKFSKIINGTREVQPHEVPLVLRYFGLKITPAHTPQGFSEPSVTPFDQPAGNATALIKALAPDVKHGATYRAPKDYIGFGILTGDVLIVDLGTPAESGNLVIATTSDPDLDVQATVLRRLVGRFLVTDAPGDTPAEIMEDSQAIGIVGVMRALARPATPKVTES